MLKASLVYRLCRQRAGTASSHGARLHQLTSSRQASAIALIQAAWWLAPGPAAAMR